MRGISGITVCLAVALAACCGLSQVRRALVAGCDIYADGLEPLATSVNDANGFRDQILCAAAGYWSPEGVVTVLDGQATRERVRAEIAAAAAQCASGDIFLFMYSGHGRREYYEGAYYEFLCLYDLDYGDWELGADLAQFDSGVTVLVVLDTCHSGGLFDVEGTADSAAVDALGTSVSTFAERALEAYREAKWANPRREVLASKAALGANIAFMTASRKDQYAWVYEMPYSLYTSYVLEGVRGWRADASDDGALSFLELHQYAASRVKVRTAADVLQSPQALHPEVLGRVMALGEPDRVRMAYDALTVTEGEGFVDVRLLREGSGEKSVSVGVFTSGESAIPGLDYTIPKERQVSWVAGDLAPKAVRIAISDDMRVEGRETFWVWCDGATRAILHPTATATRVTILDNDSAGASEVRFTAPAVSVLEDAGFASLTVARAGASGASLLRYRTVADSASAGEDFVAVTGELAWVVGDASSRVIRVPVLGDGVWEEDERFQVELYEPSGAALGEPSKVSVTVKNVGSVRAPGRLRLTDVRLAAREGGPPVRVTALREGGSDGAVEAWLSTVAGSARPNVHFVPVRQRLRWEHGEADAKSVEVTLLDDGTYTPDLSFTVQATGFTGGLTTLKGEAVCEVRRRDALASASLGEALDQQGWEVQTSGLWYGQEGESRDGSDSAQVRGADLAAGGQAWMRVSVTGPGVLGFSWRSAAQEADVLECLAGKRVLARQTGATVWERVEGLVVPAGPQTLIWRFTRGVTSAGGAAWVDEVVWSPDAARAVCDTPPDGALMTADPPQVSWGTAPGAVGYRIYLGGSGAVQTQRVAETSESEVQLPPLTPGATYFWRVDTLSAAGRVTAGPVWSFRMPAGALARVASPGDQEATVGVAYRLEAAPEPGSPAVTGYRYEGLPPGLVATADGVITGRPVRAGTNRVSVAAVNGVGVGQRQFFTLTVRPMPAEVVGRFSGLTGIGLGLDRQARALSGYAQLTVSASGAVSGSLRLMEGQYPLKGAFSADNEGLFFQTSLIRKTGGGATLRLRPFADPEQAGLTGLSGEWVGGGVTGRVMLARDIWLAERWRLAEHVGYYTVALPIEEVNATPYYPFGTGYMTVSLASSGGVLLAGMLSDGTGWSASSTACLAPDGAGLLIPVFATLGKGQGQVWGWLLLEPNRTGQGDNTLTDYRGRLPGGASEERMSDGVLWHAVYPTDSRQYPDGLSLWLAAIGSAYETSKAQSMEARLGRPDHQLALLFDAIPDAAGSPTVAVALAGDTVWLPQKGVMNPCGTGLKVNAQSGLFEGMFTLVDVSGGKTVSRKVTYRGVLTPLSWVYTDATYESPGGGFFLVNGLLPTPSTSWIDSYGVQLLWLPTE